MTTFGDRLFENDGVPVGFGDPGMGNVFYVNGGSDGPTTNGGDGSRSEPKQTLQAALALCISGNDDYVMVLNYGSNGRAAESWPVTVTKNQVHIIGLRATRGSKWSVTTSGDAGTNAFTVTGHRCEFANLEIGGNTTGSGIQIGNAIWGTTIHDCWFGYADGVGTHGVFVASGADAPYLTVYDNRFGQALTGDGIRIAGNATRGFIGYRGHGNIFRDIAGIAINISGAGQSIEIIDNDFQMKADTVGDAITLSATTEGCYIAGNQAAFTEAAKTTKYYVDGTTNDNDWGDNYVSGAILYP